MKSLSVENINPAERLESENSFSEASRDPITVAENHQPTVKGKFIFLGEEKFYIKGVTYGPFRPNEEGSEYHSPRIVSQDFAQMTEIGINTVRTYTVSPLWLLDLAQENNLRVMVGLPWEQHITFLDDRDRVRGIRHKITQGVRSCRDHPAVLSFTIGN